MLMLVSASAAENMSLLSRHLLPLETTLEWRTALQITNGDITITGATNVYITNNIINNFNSYYPSTFVTNDTYVTNNITTNTYVTNNVTTNTFVTNSFNYTNVSIVLTNAVDVNSNANYINFIAGNNITLLVTNRGTTNDIFIQANAVAVSTSFTSNNVPDGSAFTFNTQAGKLHMAAGAGVVYITNNLVFTNSIVMVSYTTPNPGGMLYPDVTNGLLRLVINGTAPIGDSDWNWYIVNPL